MNEDKILAQVEACRHMNVDGTKAIYDLSAGVDFAARKELAEAVARTIWEKDLKAFWSTTRDGPAFTPKYDIEVKLPAALGKKEQKTADRIVKDLEETDMSSDFSDYLSRVSEVNLGFGTFMLLGIGNSILYSHLEEKAKKGEELDRLFRLMSPHITITEANE